LKSTEKALFVEQVDPFIEDNVMALYARDAQELGSITFFGQFNGAIGGLNGPGVGEMNTDIVVDALKRMLALKGADNSTYQNKAREIASRMLIPREIAFCSGCPHRASFYAIKTALILDGRNGFVVGDIGCYGLAAGATGFNQIKALHCMGSGSGNVSGFSKMASFGSEQPAVAVMGDSTFYHASLPALVNAKHNNAKALFIILDNSVTAMTGFQKNPATPFGDPLQGPPQVPIEKITESLDIETKVLDPIADVNESIQTVYDFLQKENVTAIVFRRVCATYEINKIAVPHGLAASIDKGKCIGPSCGCNRFCSRVLGCPAIKYDQDDQVGYIEKDLCNACSLCVQICPEQAISIVGSESSKKEKQ
jgi:indolepyruvate ferredoxin oxidoreductase alpha subunit